MSPILRNIIAVIVGIVVGSIVNGALIMLSPYVIQPPAGADVLTTEGLKASLHLFEPQHFIFPFLAHALGTLVGAILATKIAATHHFKLAMGIGVFFLIGGIANVVILPSPLWFTIVDLVFAYLPMSYLGYTIARKKSAIAS